jgi:hypothetical protein
VAEPDRTKYLRIALRVVGLTFIVGIYTLVIVWPSGRSWHTGQSHHLPHYLQMILGIYATLGVFLLIASRNPLANLVVGAQSRGRRSDRSSGRVPGNYRNSRLICRWLHIQRRDDCLSCQELWLKYSRLQQLAGGTQRRSAS